ncbi:hypothetical protein LTR36_000735 [Oleoguttula mirabilis]|uniref:Uncharacterized protein n=1 Tax=Oleoguttula mirabilis TaxID=1507867 RepID=A0AAV9JQU4_9PEZI|nr:hypothetical protein LTR36_000735 [Oleoguttula mirabilis]
MDKLSPEAKFKKVKENFSAQRRVAFRALEDAPIYSTTSAANKKTVVAALVKHCNELFRAAAYIYGVDKHSFSADEFSLGDSKTFSAVSLSKGSRNAGDMWPHPTDESDVDDNDVDIPVTSSFTASGGESFGGKRRAGDSAGGIKSKRARKEIKKEDSPGHFEQEQMESYAEAVNAPQPSEISATQAPQSRAVGTVKGREDGTAPTVREGPAASAVNAHEDIETASMRAGGEVDVQAVNAGDEIREDLIGNASNGTKAQR